VKTVHDPLTENKKRARIILFNIIFQNVSFFNYMRCIRFDLSVSHVIYIQCDIQNAKFLPHNVKNVFKIIIPARAQAVTPLLSLRRPVSAAGLRRDNTLSPLSGERNNKITLSPL
jgi:hypothetical protein